MKKVMMTMALLLTLTTGVQAVQDKHTKDVEELVDSTSKNGVEVFSDTAAVDSLAEQPVDSNYHPMSTVDRVLSQMDDNGLMGMLFVFGVLMILFVLSPVLIIIALFYFITKNRRDKMKLAQMAMQSGQPIPQKLLEDVQSNTADDFQAGMRQCFVGVGLMVFLGFAAGEVGFGIGALVFCIGLGKLAASKMAERKAKKDNDLTIQNYD